MTGQQPRTREQAIENAARVLAEIRRMVAQLTPREQAERAWHAGGKFTVDELEDRIRARRGLPPLDRTTGAAPDAAAS